MIRSVLKYNRTQADKRGNPLRFQDSTKNFKLARAIVGLLAVGLPIIIYWFFLTPAFAIEKIKIQGTFIWPREHLVSLINNQLAQKRWFIARQNNIFTFDKSTFANIAEEQFIIDKIDIKKEYPDTIIITTTEKPRKALWSSRGIIYNLDAEGIITGLADLNSKENQFIIYNKSAENSEISNSGRGALNVGTPALSSQTMNFINNLITNEFIASLNPLFAIASGLNPDYVIVKFSETKHPTAGWSVYFGVNNTLETQISNLKVVLQHSILPDKRQSLNYIDLRFDFDNKVYYQ